MDQQHVDRLERVGYTDLKEYSGGDPIAEYHCPKCEKIGQEGLLYLQEENKIGEPIYMCQTCAEHFILSIYE